MAKRKFTVDKALDAVFDNDFGLSEGESSDKEDGEEAFAYFGDPVFLCSEIEELTWDLDDEDEGDLHDFSDDGIAVFSYTNSEELLGGARQCDHGCGYGHGQGCGAE